MSKTILSIAGGMLVIPFVILSAIEITGNAIPFQVLFTGGWIMALGVIAVGIGAVVAAYGE